jgi:hypothetical protein
MADVKISQLTAKAAKVESTDRIPIADFNGTTYDTKYVTGAEINEVSLDTSPQLGGNLDVNGHTITSASNGNIQIRPNGTGAVLIGDSSGSNAAPLRFMELSDNGTNYVGLRAANNLSTNTTYTLPTADGTSGQVLSTNGTGTLSWTNNDSGLTVNSTAIASGTAGRVFFQNASNQLSQSANLFWDNSNSRLGINTATPTVELDVLGQGRFHTSTANQLILSNPTYANGRVRINITDNFSFQIIDNTGYGITHSSFDTGINSRQTNISLWTQSGNTTTLRFGGQDTNPTVARTRSIILPVPSNTTQFSPTSGTAVDYSFQNPGNSSFAPSSGTASYTQVELRPTFNTTSTYSGIGRGLYYNPILTSEVGLTHRAIETTTGSVIFNSTSGNVAIGGTSFGTSSDKVLAQYTGTAPGSSPADAYQQYSADITAGNAAPHFRTENGNVVKLYQQSSAGITTVSDLITILQNLGLLS